MIRIRTARWPKRGESLVLRGVEWDWYANLARKRDPGVRLAYDRGTLEIMAPSLEHDRADRVLARFVVTLTEELGLPIVEGGSTTLKRSSKKRGIEADEIFWIAHAATMAGKRRVNLRTDPPPDLAIEVDVTNSSVDRLAICAVFGIPEVWRLKGGTLSFLTLTPERAYSLASRSRAFPFVAPDDLIPFLEMAITGGNTNAAVYSLREWIRARASRPA